MNKRAFLRNAAGLFLAPLAGRLLAAPAAGNSRFLLVFLRGGYDAANVLIPVSSGFYYESRPNIAVARESVLPLDRKSTRLNSSHLVISYAVFCLKKKN